jgi:hypothetical protein
MELSQLCTLFGSAELETTLPIHISNGNRTANSYHWKTNGVNQVLCNLFGCFKLCKRINIDDSNYANE